MEKKQTVERKANRAASSDTDTEDNGNDIALYCGLLSSGSLCTGLSSNHHHHRQISSKINVIKGFERFQNLNVRAGVCFKLQMISQKRLGYKAK
jgi:hypothetical protein